MATGSCLFMPSVHFVQQYNDFFYYSDGRVFAGTQGRTTAGYVYYNRSGNGCECVGLRKILYSRDIDLFDGMYQFAGSLALTAYIFMQKRKEWHDIRRLNLAL